MSSYPVRSPAAQKTRCLPSSGDFSSRDFAGFHLELSFSWETVLAEPPLPALWFRRNNAQNHAFEGGAGAGGGGTAADLKKTFQLTISAGLRLWHKPSTRTQKEKKIKHETIGYLGETAPFFWSFLGKGVGVSKNDTILERWEWLIKYKIIISWNTIHRFWYSWGKV